MDSKFKENAKEFEKSRIELDKRFKETDAKFKETDTQIKEAFKLFESQWGKLIESLVAGDLVRILKERNIEVTDTSTRRKGSKHGMN